jgi:hypothetical protein
MSIHLRVYIQLFTLNLTFLAKLENDFFASLEDSGGNKMNRAGFIALGKKSNASLNDELPLPVVGNILSSIFGKRNMVFILSLACLSKSLDESILLTNFLTFL